MIAAGLLLGLTLNVHATDLITFKELSLMVRMSAPQQVMEEAAFRKLLRPLSAKEEASLMSSGAAPALIVALRSPALLATPEMVAAFEVSHKAAVATDAAQKLSLEASVTQLAASKAEADRKRVVNAVLVPYTNDLQDAISAPPMSLKASDAFSLSQLEQAKAKAREERKPLGFLMVWGQFFGPSSGTRAGGSVPALVHFYRAFNKSLVLVFVRHETELDAVPAAVKQGFQGPDEGGYAPNMAVVDATATEFLTEIPMAVNNVILPPDQRDAAFSAGAQKIATWLVDHPSACASQPSKR